MITRNCKECNKPLEGRKDQIFCSPYCKSSFHYEKNKPNEESLFKRIDKQLKINRKILKDYNKSGKAFVRKEVLLSSGFNPRFVTHYWKGQNSNTYLFVYEYGFLETIDNGKHKYVLVKWQPYMEKQLNLTNPHDNSNTPQAAQ